MYWLIVVVTNVMSALINSMWCIWHTHTHPFNGPFSGTRKAKPVWILLKQETVSGIGISWAICKSAPLSRQPRQQPTTQFLQAGCPSCHQTNSVKALKAFVMYMAFSFIDCETCSLLWCSKVIFVAFGWKYNKSCYFEKLQDDLRMPHMHRQPKNIMPLAPSIGWAEVFETWILQCINAIFAIHAQILLGKCSFFCIHID